MADAGPWPIQWHIESIPQALSERTHPSVTVWNRLEGRPRTTDFDRAMKAELRDPLWMLTRQWQLGEFRGDDAGSPVFARLHLSTTPLTKYRSRDLAAERLDADVPLEATVERRPVPLVRGDRDIALDLRLVMGRQWLKLTTGIGDYREQFTKRYPVELPDSPSAQDNDRYAHPEVWQAFAAAAGRRMDGGKLYLHLTASADHHAYDAIGDIADADKPLLDEQAARFVAWFERLFLQPADNAGAWVPERLEYQFACSAPERDDEQVFVAQEYAQGRLDWHAVDIDAASRGLGGTPGGDDSTTPATPTRTLIPVPVEFDGMPNTRWWAFEEGRTNIGAVDASTTDLAKLLFVEFQLVYANDWFVVPCTLPTGTNARVRGLTVDNVFGERFWIKAAGTADDDNWQRWSMFTHSTSDATHEAIDAGLLLLPTAPKVQEGPPVEEVVLVRDEIANMVWGVERVVSLPSGHSRPGSEVADETRQWFERQAGPPDTSVPAPRATARYRVMSSVPENWIPLVPARVQGSNRNIQLQRAGMPRIIEGQTGRPAKIEPRTTLLREGLDSDTPLPYLLHEEQVPRAGVRIAQAFQRARARDGRPVVWLGAHKRTAHGQASSGLAFDQLIDVPPPNA